MCKGRCDFFKRNSVVLYGVIALLVIVVLYLSCSKTNCCSKDFIIAFIAAVASMVVIGNFSQVSRIQDETDKKMNCLKDEMERKINSLKDEMNAGEKKVMDETAKLSDRIDEVDSYCVKDIWKKENDKCIKEIKEHYRRNNLGELYDINRLKLPDCPATKYFSAFKNEKEFVVIRYTPKNYEGSGITELDPSEYNEMLNGENSKED